MDKNPHINRSTNADSPPRPKEIVFTFAGQIDQLAAAAFFRSFGNAVNDGIEHVHLIFQSSGGLVSDGVAIHNFLKSLPLRITVYNLGLVASIGVIVYLAGEVRVASPASKFVIHKAAAAGQQSSTAGAMRAMADAMEIDDRIIESILRSNTTISVEQWTLHERTDVIMGATEAAVAGIAHEVIDFKFPEGTPFFNIGM